MIPMRLRLKNFDPIGSGLLDNDAMPPTALLAPDGVLLMLVKPQFELQPGQVGKGGIVRDAALYAVVEKRIRDCCTDLGLAVTAWLDSPIQGGDGNREFFVYARRAA